jgi:hypothetical protein
VLSSPVTSQSPVPDPIWVKPPTPSSAISAGTGTLVRWYDPTIYLGFAACYRYGCLACSPEFEAFLTDKMVWMGTAGVWFIRGRGKVLCRGHASDLPCAACRGGQHRRKPR